MSVKKCFYFPTWEEQKNVMISLDGGSISFPCDESFKYKEVFKGTYSGILVQSTPSDPILAKLCELTGVKMYGDYVVLDKINLYSCYTLWNKYDRFSGDLIELDSREYGCRCNQKFEHCKGCLKLCNKEFEKNWSDADSDWYTNETIYNIFQEYSKFLRNEENKWEEVRKVLDI